MSAVGGDVPQLPLVVEGPAPLAQQPLDTPERVQAYLDRLPYNLEPGGDTLRSPRRVMRDQTAHCAEGAIFE